MDGWMLATGLQQGALGMGGTGLIRTAVVLTGASLGFMACGPASVARDDARIRREVSAYADTIALDLRREGPRAWLRHFARTPAFFMASDGRLLFPDNDSADAFVEGLARRVRGVELEWREIRVDPLSPTLALIAAPFHEVVTDTAGTPLSFDGYFTAVAELNPSGWTLRNAHWSLAVGGE